MMFVRSPILFILVGPSGGGKTTCEQALLADYPGSLVKVITVTSRAPRAGEVDGLNYLFVSKDEFRRKQKNGEFFEWEETHGNLYGTLNNSLGELIVNPLLPKTEAPSINGIPQIDRLFNIDLRGAMTFKRSFPNNVVVVCMIPPTREVLKDRLVSRGTSGEELQTRLATAEREYKQILSCSDVIDYLVVNDQLDRAIENIKDILNAERSKISRISRNTIEGFCG
jgi:guanylate kinase